MVIRKRIAGLALALSLGALACGDDPFPNADELDKIKGLSPLARLVNDPSNRFQTNTAAEQLGHALFDDEGLSGCGDISCASCHKPDHGYTVEEPLAKGCFDQNSERNPLSLLNSGHSRWYMWDGRADRLWSQALLPILNPKEMGSSAAIVRARIESAYAEDYLAIFGKAPTAETDDNRLLSNVGKAIAAYEAVLTRTKAPFDTDVARFVAAAEAGNAESDPLYVGLDMFMRKGKCFSCHKGPAFSDDLFHNIGLEDRTDERNGQRDGTPQLLGSAFRADGEYSDDRSTFVTRLTNLQTDLDTDPDVMIGAFKTPTLRNVELTAPYMHTGHLATLDDVLDFYARGGDANGSFAGTRTSTISSFDMSSAERAALLALLKSLTGEAPTQ